MLLRPTRVHAKIVWFHISASGYAKNAPDFTFPNKDAPKTSPILGLNLRRGSFRGVCFCAPTRVRVKFGGFHISAYGYAKNAPDFTFPNKDTPKTSPVLDPNRRRETFQGVCNAPLHGYVQNPPGFRPRPSVQDISGRMQYAPTRVHKKSARFHISAHGYAKNAPDFILLNKDACKTRPVLHPNRRRRIFRGVCFCATTRVRAKPARFHISAHEYAKNAPDFTLPNRDTPKTRLVLGANPCRKTFRGVCNTPLHGYVQNLAGFIFPHTDTPKTHPISPFPIRIYPNPARFQTQTIVEGHFGAYAIRPYTGAPKTRRLLDFATRHSLKPGGFWTLPHDMARNPAGFGLCHTTWRKTWRVLDFATRHGAKPGGFWTLPLDIAQNPAGFGLRHST